MTKYGVLLSFVICLLIFVPALNDDSAKNSIYNDPMKVTSITDKLFPPESNEDNFTINNTLRGLAEEAKGTITVTIDGVTEKISGSDIQFPDEWAKIAGDLKKGLTSFVKSASGEVLETIFSKFGLGQADVQKATTAMVGWGASYLDENGVEQPTVPKGSLIAKNIIWESPEKNLIRQNVWKLRLNTQKSYKISYVYIAEHSKTNYDFYGGGTTIPMSEWIGNRKSVPELIKTFVCFGTADNGLLWVPNLVKKPTSGWVGGLIDVGNTTVLYERGRKDGESPKYYYVYYLPPTVFTKICPDTMLWKFRMNLLYMATLTAIRSSNGFSVETLLGLDASNEFLNKIQAYMESNPELADELIGLIGGN